MSVGAGHMQAQLFDIKRHTHEHGLPNLIWYRGNMWPVQMMHFPECFHPDDIKATHDSYYAPIFDHSGFIEELEKIGDWRIWMGKAGALLDEHKNAAMADREDIKGQLRRLVEAEVLTAGVQWSETEVKDFAKELRHIYGY